MSIFTKITNYLKESIQEMRKVVWPSKKQTMTYSAIVVIMSVGVALFFGILDYVLNIGLEKIVK